MKRISLNRKILLIVLGFTIVSQLVYLFINVRSFQKSYNHVVRTNLATVGNSLGENLNYILNKGISINKLVGLKPLLRGILSDAPNLSFIAVHDLAHQWLYYCDRDVFLNGDELAAAKGIKLFTTTDNFKLPFPLKFVASIAMSFVV